MYENVKKSIENLIIEALFKTLEFTYFIVGHSHSLILVVYVHSLFLQLENDLREIETSFTSLYFINLE